MDIIKRENLINALKLDLLPEDDRVALLDEASEYLKQRLMLRIFELLKDEDRKEFSKILEKGSDEQFQTFAASKVPNFLDLIGEEIDLLQKKMSVYGQK